jgi:hypothetical protein
MYLFAILFSSLVAIAAANNDFSAKPERIPKFLTDCPLPHGYPWGEQTAFNSNPHRDAPNTGVVRYYNFTLTRENVNIDGFGMSLH